MEEFVDSQEETFQQLMDIGNETQRADELKRTEAITVPDSDSAEQTEFPPNDGLEVTTVDNQTGAESTDERLPEGKPCQE